MLLIPGSDRRDSCDCGAGLQRGNEGRFGVQMQHYRTQLTTLGNAGVAAITVPFIALGMLAACALQLLFIASITGLVHAKYHAQQCSWMRQTY